MRWCDPGHNWFITLWRCQIWKTVSNCENRELHNNSWGEWEVGTLSVQDKVDVHLESKTPQCA